MSAVCVCGREFAKPFGLRVHERTCPRALAVGEDQGGCEDEGCPTCDAGVYCAHHDDPDSVVAFGAGAKWR